MLHLPQVRLVARSIWDRLRFAVELDDLIGYGTIGLLRAVERFDPQRGILLKTYAEHRIRGAILDGLRGMDWLPRSARQKERQREGSNGAMETCSRDRSAGRRKRVSSRGEGQPLPARHDVPSMKSVFPSGNLGDLQKLAESVQARRGLSWNGTDPESLYARKEAYERLAAAVAQLPRRHQQVLKLYYEHNCSMKQIGCFLQVHESRVSQLHAAAIARLRKQLAGLQKSPDELRKPPARYSAACYEEADSRSRLTA